MPTSSLPQVYVLHPAEWGTSLLLRAGYSPAHWDKVCICRAGKKKRITTEKQQQDTAERNACCDMDLRMRKGKGKVKKEAKHWMSPVWQCSLKYNALLPCLQRLLIQSWACSLTQLGMCWFTNCKHLYCNFLLMFDKRVFNSFFLITKNTKLYSHFPPGL